MNWLTDKLAAAIDNPVQAVVVAVVVAFAVGTALFYPAVWLVDRIRRHRREP